MRRLLGIAALAAGLLAPASAQCVMCYRTAKAQNAARARVLDVGIIALGAPPFLILAGFVAFVFVRGNKCAEEDSPTTGTSSRTESASKS
jgi:ABC-type amino acid transport substrate-binding protein